VKEDLDYMKHKPKPPNPRIVGEAALHSESAEIQTQVKSNQQVGIEHSLDQERSTSETLSQANLNQDTPAVLISRIGAAFSALGGPNLARAESILADFETTHAGHLSDKQASALSYHFLTLTRIYTAIKQPANALRTAWKMLETHGFVIKKYKQSDHPYKFELEQWGTTTELVVETWLHICKAYANLSVVAQDECDELEGHAWTAWYAFYGDGDAFDEERDTLIRKPSFEGMNLADAFEEGSHQ